MSMTPAEESDDDYASILAAIYEEVAELDYDNPDATARYAAIRQEAATLEEPDLLAYALVVEALHAFTRDDFDRVLDRYNQYTALLATDGGVIREDVTNYGAMVGLGVFGILADDPHVERERVEAFIDRAHEGDALNRRHHIISALMELFWAAQWSDGDEVDAAAEEVLENLDPEDADYLTMKITVAKALVSFNADLAFELTLGLADQTDDDSQVISAEVTRADALRELWRQDYAVQIVRALVDHFGMDAVVEHGDHATLLYVAEPDPALADQLYEAIRPEVDFDDLDDGEMLMSLGRHLLLRNPNDRAGRALLKRARARAEAFDKRNGSLAQRRYFDEFTEGLGEPPATPPGTDPSPEATTATPLSDAQRSYDRLQPVIMSAVGHGSIAAAVKGYLELREAIHHDPDGADEELRANYPFLWNRVFRQLVADPATEKAAIEEHCEWMRQDAEGDDVEALIANNCLLSWAVQRGDEAEARQRFDRFTQLQPGVTHLPSVDKLTRVAASEFAQIDPQHTLRYLEQEREAQGGSLETFAEVLRESLVAQVGYPQDALQMLRELVDKIGWQGVQYGSEPYDALTAAEADATMAWPLFHALDGAFDEEVPPITMMNCAAFVRQALLRNPEDPKALELQERVRAYAKALDRRNGVEVVAPRWEARWFKGLRH